MYGDSSTACEGLLGRQVDGQRDDLGSRHHHVVDLLVGEVEDLVEHLLLALLDLAALGRLARASIFSSASECTPPLGARRLEAEEHAGRLGRSSQEPDQRTRHGEERPHRRGDRQRGPLRVPERDRLRHELADHDVEERDDQVREHHREHGRDHRVERARERVLAESTDPQRGERDAELHRGDEPRRRVGDPEHLARAPVSPSASSCIRVRRTVTSAVLGRDEEPVQQDQRRDGEKLEEERHAPLSGARGLRGSSKGSITAQYRSRFRRPRCARPGPRGPAARGARAPRRRRNGAAGAGAPRRRRLSRRS